MAGTMMSRLGDVALRIALAVAMVYAMLLPPASLSASHHPAALALAEIERHAVLAVVDGDHGHSHHDGRAEERHAGHAHGHNPADHSHDVPATAAIQAPPFPRIDDGPKAVAPDAHMQNPSFRIKRPPRA